MAKVKPILKGEPVGRSSTYEEYFPTEDEMELVVKTPLWKKIETYIEENYDAELIIAKDDDLLFMKKQAYQAAHYAGAKSIFRGEQSVQAMEYETQAMLEIIDSFFKGWFNKGGNPDEDLTEEEWINLENALREE